MFNRNTFKKRILFVGIPDMAYIGLDGLLMAGVNIVGVLGPKKDHSMFHDFKNFVLARGLNYIDYDQLDEPQLIEQVKKLDVDAAVVCSFNYKIPRVLMNATRDGFINVHPSMLPKYRGGNPYSRVIMNGETETGVTIHFMDEGFDTGDIIAQKGYHIHSKATMGTIFNELNVLGIELLLQVLQAYETEELPRIPQPRGDFISGKGLVDGEIFINYNRSAEEIERFIRALNPFILASTTFRGNMMKIMKAEVASDAFCIPHPAGTVAKIEDDKFFIATSKGLIVPTVLQFGSFFIGDSKDFIRIVNPKIGEEFK
ncbi:MAG: methionyl-tRNA formyltransferase [Candidatus Gastranaerophilales bacterium]|nr:methionyl-tRNA formyltransferase [Candidatus Gastranaerophilales bacterium]